MPFALAPGVVEGCRLDDEARRAEAALQRIERHERLLHRMQRFRADAFDGGDRLARDGLRRRQAADDRHAVQQHRAGAADAGAADELGAGEPEVVAQHIGQKRFWIVWQGGWTAVDGDAAHDKRLTFGCGISLAVEFCSSCSIWADDADHRAGDDQPDDALQVVEKARLEAQVVEAARPRSGSRAQDRTRSCFSRSARPCARQTRSMVSMCSLTFCSLKLWIRSRVCVCRSDRSSSGCEVSSRHSTM